MSSTAESSSVTQAKESLVKKFVSSLKKLNWKNLKKAFGNGKDATIKFVTENSPKAQQLVKDHGLKVAGTIIVAAVAYYVYRRMTRATPGNMTDTKALASPKTGGRRRRRSSKRKQKRKSSKRKQKRRSKRRSSKRRR